MKYQLTVFYVRQIKDCLSMIKMRQMVEREILSAFIDSALAAGKRLAVSLERGYDVDEMLLGSVDKNAVLDAATAGDECHVFVQRADGPTVSDGRVVSEGWVYFVFGNDGWDVISDYTTSLEYLMEAANAVAERYED
jgi:hypothetical protein